MIVFLVGLPGQPNGWSRESGTSGQSIPVLPIKGNGRETGGSEVPLELDVLTVGTAALSGDPGRYGYARIQAAATYSHITLGYAHRVFQWEAVGSLPFGNGRDDPLAGIETVSLKLKKKGPIAGQWRYHLSGEVSSSFEKQPVTPSLDILAALGYDFSPRFKVRVGAAAFLHEVRSVVVPLAAFKFWSSRSVNGTFFTIDVGLPETTVSYHYSPRWEFSGSFLADSTVADLADGSPVSADGFVETRDIVMGLQARYRPVPFLTLTGGMGYDAFRRLRFYAPNGAKIGDYGVEGALSGRFVLTIRF